eukprot:scaffold65312_cov33-Tisochrysis_lutea.AAC.2
MVVEVGSQSFGSPPRPSLAQSVQSGISPRLGTATKLTSELVPHLEHGPAAGRAGCASPSPGRAPRHSAHEYGSSPHMATADGGMPSHLACTHTSHLSHCSMEASLPRSLQKCSHTGQYSRLTHRPLQGAQSVPPLEAERHRVSADPQPRQLRAARDRFLCERPHAVLACLFQLACARTRAVLDAPAAGSVTTAGAWVPVSRNSDASSHAAAKA